MVLFFLSFKRKKCVCAHARVHVCVCVCVCVCWSCLCLCTFFGFFGLFSMKVSSRSQSIGSDKFKISTMRHNSLCRIQPGAMKLVL